MQWWFYTATPIAWSLLIVRVLQNLVEDYGLYRKGEPFQIQVGMLGE